MKISVIVPCYNVQSYIGDCLSSLLEQTIGPDALEIILVDDCSTDNTPALLTEYEAAHPEQIVLVFSEENGRQGAARNIGLSYATGDYVSFVDADDYVRKDMYEILLKIVSDHDPDLIQFRYIDSRKEDPTLPVPPVSVYDFSDPVYRKQYVMRTDILSQSCTTLFYKRTLLVRAGVRFAEHVAYEEPLFTYPLKYEAQKVCVLEMPLYCYRLNEEGTTASYMSRPSTITDHLKVQQALLDHMKATPHYAIYKNEIELYYLHSFFAEPFYFMHYRGTSLPVVLFRFMCREVRLHVPDYRDNPYWQDPLLAEEYALVCLIDELAASSDEEADRIIRALTLS